MGDDGRRADATGPGTAPCLLLVDDDDVVLDVAARILRRAGFHVQCAQDAEQALAAARDVRPSLLITDIVMPGADGWALARRLSLEHPGLRVLYTSGCNSEEAGAPAVPPSRRGFLCKPYSSRELLGAVHALLGALAA